jgi:hypothetical protein
MSNFKKYINDLLENLGKHYMICYVNQEEKKSND